MNSVALEFMESHVVKWSVQKIGDVCRLINGRAYKKGELLDEGRYRVLRVGNFFTSNHWYFSDLELEADKYCEDGDLLYAWSASFGPRVWRGTKTIYHYHIWKIEPDPTKVLRDFLFYFFEWDKDLIRKEQGAGATMTHVSKESMEARPIPLPPLDEQQRIVAVLDQAFAALDRARAHAEANLADSGELLRSAQISAAADHNDWITAEISAIIKVKSGDFLPSKAMDAAGIIPVFGGNGQTGLHNESNLKGRNILIGRVGAKCGNVRVVDGPIWLTDNAFHVSKLYRDFDLDFLALLLSKADLRTTANQAAQPAISGTTIGVVKVRFPDSIEDQRRHVMRVRSIETKTLELVEAYERKLSELTTLRQSLLQKAFSGELA